MSAYVLLSSVLVRTPKSRDSLSCIALALRQPGKQRTLRQD
jgi:hypothetical protein